MVWDIVQALAIFFIGIPLGVFILVYLFSSWARFFGTLGFLSLAVGGVGMLVT